MTDRLPHLLRSDAQGNRDRVLAAARELFATQGLPGDCRGRRR